MLTLLYHRKLICFITIIFLLPGLGVNLAQGGQDKSITSGIRNDASSGLPFDQQMITGPQSWSKHFGNIGYDNGSSGYSLATDRSGNVFVTGMFDETVDFGGGPFTALYAPDIFLAKYDTNGNHLWSKQFGDSEIDYGLSLALDPEGNVFVTGYFRKTSDFGNGPLKSAGSDDIFLAKFDPNGNPLWSKRFGDINNDHGYALTTDASGNVYLTGSFEGTVDFGGGELHSAGYEDIFLSKFDGNGKPLWSKRFGDDYGEEGTNLAVDSQGNVYLTGTFFTKIDFGDGGVSYINGNYPFLVKFDTQGNHIWSRFYAEDEILTIKGLAIDSDDNFYLAGGFHQDINLGNGQISAVGGSDAFLAKYDASGNHIWSKHFGQYGDEVLLNLAISPSDNVVMAGNYQYTVDFGGGPMDSIYPGDLFLARYDQNGRNLQSNHYHASIGSVYSVDLAADASESTYMTGGFSGSIDFGNGPMASDGAEDVLLAKFMYPQLFLPLVSR